MNKYYIQKSNNMKNDIYAVACLAIMGDWRKFRKFKISRKKRRFIRLDRAVRKSNVRFKGYTTRKSYVDAQTLWYKSKKKCLTSFDMYPQFSLELIEQPQTYSVFEPIRDIIDE